MPNPPMTPTPVWPVDASRPDPTVIEAAAACLRNGGLVAFPTETVYGLGVDALNVEAVRRLFVAKGRPATDPLIVHVPGVAQLESVAHSVSVLAWQLAEAFWPGPLTLVLPRRPIVPLEVTAGKETVAVRAPSHPVAQALLAVARTPIAAPSANRFSRPSPTTAQHVLDDLNGLIDGVLDAGPTNIGLESTIVDVTRTPPHVLRPGGLKLETLRRFVPNLVVSERFLEESIAADAPGMFLKHYAPCAELRLYEGPREAVLAAMRLAAGALAQAGRRVGVLALAGEAVHFAGLPVEWADLGPESEPEEIGRRLFAALRDLDARGVEVIFARLPAPEGLGWAVRDRLRRAAAGHIIKVE
ncbi:MAG: L-threonylcarbamoyladenylate synthase [Anaerolineales bacterium]|nr:L-threonylcarbamoyladenylate synthase [Anaerolineales bacterium]